MALVQQIMKCTAERNPPDIYPILAWYRLLVYKGLPQYFFLVNSLIWNCFPSHDIQLSLRPGGIWPGKNGDWIINWGKIVWQPLLSFHFPFHYPFYIGLLTRKNNLWQPHHFLSVFFPPNSLFFAFPNFTVSHWTQISRVFKDFSRDVPKCLLKFKDTCRKNIHSFNGQNSVLLGINNTSTFLNFQCNCNPSQIIMKQDVSVSE